MLPPELKTPEIEKLTKLVGTGHINFAALENLTSDDLKVFAAFIQFYNYIEINLRRSIEAFDHGQILSNEASKRRRKLRAAELVPIAKDAVQKMSPDQEDIFDTLAKLTEIEFRRPYRNLLAHWGARRIPGHDAIVFLTMNNQDALQVLGKDLEIASLATATLRMADLRGLTVSISEHEKWLSLKTSEWCEKYLPKQAITSTSEK